MVSLRRQKHCLTFLTTKQTKQQNKAPFYQRLSWRTTEFNVLTEQGGKVSVRCVGGPKEKGLEASWVMASPWLCRWSLPLSSWSTHSSPSPVPLPQATCWKEWLALRWGLSDPPHTLLLGGNVNSPQNQQWWHQAQPISWRWRLLGVENHIPAAHNQGLFSGKQ